MGVWGIEPWQSDGAATWFGESLKATSFDEHIREAFKFVDGHQEIRAACHLLAGLGQPGVWPGQTLVLGEFLREGIKLLNDMLDPENEETDFLELCDNDPEVIASVRAQIAALEKNLARLGEDAIGVVRAETFGAHAQTNKADE
jgi:hypothetical protein